MFKVNVQYILDHTQPISFSTFSNWTCHVPFKDLIQRKKWNIKTWFWLSLDFLILTSCKKNYFSNAILLFWKKLFSTKNHGSRVRYISYLSEVVRLSPYILQHIFSFKIWDLSHFKLNFMDTFCRINILWILFLS